VKTDKRTVLRNKNLALVRTIPIAKHRAYHNDLIAEEDCGKRDHHAKQWAVKEKATHPSNDLNHIRHHMQSKQLQNTYMYYGTSQQ
jgi:hypothetical protein